VCDCTDSLADANIGLVTFKVKAGEDVTCTFTNAQDEPEPDFKIYLPLILKLCGWWPWQDMRSNGGGWGSHAGFLVGATPGAPAVSHPSRDAKYVCRAFDPVRPSGPVLRYLSGRSSLR